MSNDELDHSWPPQSEELNWNLSEDMQRRGIERWAIYMKDSDLFATLLRSGNKPLWRNAAIALGLSGESNIMLNMPYLMEWYMDTNWPGFEEIDSLIKGNLALVGDCISKAKKRAKEENDEDWIDNLDYYFNDQKNS